MLSALKANAEPTAMKYSPRGERRLIVYHDIAQGWTATNPAKNTIAADYLKDPESWKKSVQEVVRAHAEAGVDTIVKCVFVRFSTNMAPGVSQVTEPVYNQVHWTHPLKDMNEAGQDLVQIYLDEAHKQGMAFIAGLRMNDRHGEAIKGKVYKAHPEWHAEGIPRGLDYAHQGVRDMMATFIGDVVDHYDVDGVEFDWMRWIYMFSAGKEQENAHLLTGFHRRIRKLLDEAGKKRGRPLLLGVRVPDAFEESALYGFDVETWIKEGLVDYVVPSQFGYMDFSAKIEKYRRLTEGTDCRVYPSLNLWTGPCRQERAGGWQPEHYYAASHNYYASGADGISTYNYMPNTMGRIEVLLPRLIELEPITNPATLAKHYRDYLFWRRRIGKVHPSSPVGSIQYAVIHLDRAKAGARGTFDFRLADDLTRQDVSAVMEFKAVGMDEDDAVEVQLNGKTVSPEIVKRFYIWDGTDHKGKYGPYYLYRLPLGPRSLVFGDNEIAVGLTNAASNTGVIRIEEVNVKVHPR